MQSTFWSRFGVRLTFTEEEITLDAAELAQEHTLNAEDRVMLVLKDVKGGRAYPADIAEKSEMPLGTVKNALIRLRKRNLVEDTGEDDSHTKAKEVRVTEGGLSVTPSLLSKGSVIPVTLSDPPAGVIVNASGEMEL